MPVSVILRRLGYRLAYRVLQVVWWLARPNQRGVKCLLCDGDRVLLVRHTYGPRAWDLPGGMAKRGEPSAQTARREMAEELGIDGVEWTPLGTVRGRIAYRHDTIDIYGLAVPAPPPLNLDLGELEVARWFDRAAPPAPLTRYAARILEHAPAPAATDR